MSLGSTRPLRCIPEIPNYDDLRGFDLPNKMEIADISERISAGLPNPSWLTIKHRLFGAHISRKSPQSLRENAMNDKKDEFMQKRLSRRVVKIPIAKAPDGLVGMDFSDYGGKQFSSICEILFRVTQ